MPTTFERIDVIELEPEVLEANRRVGGVRKRDPLADPRIHVWLNDARGALALSGPSLRRDRLPALASLDGGRLPSLYARLLRAGAASRLAPGGVFVQWMGLRFVDESLLRSLIATLLDVFPHVRLYQADPGSILFVSSAEPLDLEGQVDAVVPRDPDDASRAPACA